MKRARHFLTICALTAAIISCGCSHKGSSSISSRKHTTTSRQTPKVRTSDSEADRAAKLKAEQEAEQKAKEQAEAAKLAAQKAKEQAKEQAEALAKEQAEKVVTREEKIKVVESKAEVDETHRYHIIIGSFKQLQNARQLCEDAISKDFLPSIMENEEGMYRVGIYSSITEKTARAKIVELRKSHPEYVGIWLLIEKK